jgi:hypothetical protein
MQARTYVGPCSRSGSFQSNAAQEEEEEEEALLAAVKKVSSPTNRQQAGRSIAQLLLTNSFSIGCIMSLVSSVQISTVPSYCPFVFVTVTRQRENSNLEQKASC